jgi:CTP synthase (UTP-ammonia lyase)
VSDAVRIGILGDFNAEFRSHHATNDALQHAARKLNMKVEYEWLPTPSLNAATVEKTLEGFDGLWGAPGSPFKSFDGMLKGIEFARNVLNIKDADSAENNSGSKNIVIYPVACAVPDRKGNAPKLSGVVPEIRLRPGSYLQSFYGKDQETATEEFFCSFEINPDVEWAAMEAGFPVVARGAQGEIRAIESPTHRFFLATLFQPQLSSTEKKPHPIVLAFVQAAADWGKKKLDDSVLE